MLTLSAQMIASTATVRAIIITQIAKEHAPTFQDWIMLLDIEESTSMHARKLAMGTRGYVGSMLMSHGLTSYEVYVR